MACGYIKILPSADSFKMNNGGFYLFGGDRQGANVVKKTTLSRLY